ncbi:nuclear transport factor 2 family protein [Chitinophagaceae bacterium LWZ2-11]
MIPHESLIKKAYAAFNARNLEAVVQLMQPDVQWPNGWEGGYVQGQDAVREYWTRQWIAIDPHVEPVSFEETIDNLIIVRVNQTIKDLQGNILNDNMVTHVYTIKNALIARMEIRSGV